MGRRGDTAGLSAHRVRQAVCDFWNVQGNRGATYVLAVSGGADSLALAAAIAHSPELMGAYTFVPVIVDHQLQADSAHVAQTALEQCRQLGLVEAIHITVDVEDRGEGPEGSARRARYEALRTVARQHGAHAIVTAHHRQDQAETVLMRLGRGSSLSSIRAMAAIAEDIWRPLLSLDRDTLTQSLLHYEITAWEDPHNSDARFLRSRIRTELMPELEAVLGPAVVDNLIKLSETAARDDDALNELAEALASTAIDEAGTLDATALKQTSGAISSRLVVLWLDRQGYNRSNLTTHLIDQITNLAIHNHQRGPLSLPADVRIEKVSGRLRLLTNGG
jgi:tRNA(Ile)-lysidine synthase